MRFSKHPAARIAISCALIFAFAILGACEKMPNRHQPDDRRAIPMPPIDGQDGMPMPPPGGPGPNQPPPHDAPMTPPGNMTPGNFDPADQHMMPEQQPGMEPGMGPGPANHNTKNQPMTGPPGTFMGQGGKIMYHKLEVDKDKQWPIIKKYLGLSKGMTVADIGCGVGDYTFYLSKEVGPSGKVFALDIPDHFLELLRDKLINKKLNPHGNIEVLQHKINDAMLKPNSVDVAASLLQHFHARPQLGQSHKQLLKSIFEGIKPGGLLIIQDGGLRDIPPGGAKNIIKHYTEAGFKLEKGPEYSKNYKEQSDAETYFLRFKKP